MLEKSYLFKNISSKEIEEILKGCKYSVKKYGSGSSIAFRGDRVDGIYINVQGVLTAEMLKSTGDIQTIEDLEVGAVAASAFIFGEENFFPVDLIAKTDTIIFYMDKESLVKLLMENKKILENFLNDISSRAQFLSKKVWNLFNSKTIREKLDEYIVRRAKGDRVEFHVSLSELSNIFSVSRPSLSRVISEYIDEGILERIGRNQYKILDREHFNKNF